MAGATASTQDLKGLAQCLINNERCLQESRQAVRELNKESKQLKSLLSDKMEDSSIDVLHKNGAKIERKQQDRKSPMNKAHVVETLQPYLSEEDLASVLTKLYDNRPKTSICIVKCTMPKQGIQVPPSESGASDRADIRDKFGLTTE